MPDSTRVCAHIEIWRQVDDSSDLVLDGWHYSWLLVEHSHGSLLTQLLVAAIHQVNHGGRVGTLTVWDRVSDPVGRCGAPLAGFGWTSFRCQASVSKVWFMWRRPSGPPDRAINSPTLSFQKAERRGRGTHYPLPPSKPLPGPTPSRTSALHGGTIYAKQQPACRRKIPD